MSKGRNYSASVAAKKKKFLACFETNNLNISKACLEAGIIRQTYYEYLSADDKFRQAVEAIQESMLDYAEDVVFEHVKDKRDPEIAIQILKLKGKPRGYHTSQTIMLGGGNKADPITINFTDAKKAA